VTPNIGPAAGGEPADACPIANGRVLGAVLVVAGRSVTPAATTAADGRSPAATLEASASLSTANATPHVVTVPEGLEPRPALPPLVDAEAAACDPDCGVGRFAGGAMPNGRYQTRWFFGG
jgi:hypothetical protein